MLPALVVRGLDHSLELMTTCVFFFSQFTTLFIDKMEAVKGTQNTATLQVCFSNYDIRKKKLLC